MALEAWCSFLRIRGEQIYRTLADYIERAAVVWCGTSAGATNVYELSPDLPLDAYRDGMRFQFVAHATNTGSSTLSVASATGFLSALTVYSAPSLAATLNAGAITVGRKITVVFREDSGALPDRFELISEGLLFSSLFRMTAWPGVIVTSESGSISVTSFSGYYIRVFQFVAFFVRVVATTSGSPNTFITVNCTPDYALLEDGHAAGVVATWNGVSSETANMEPANNYCTPVGGPLLIVVRKADRTDFAANVVFRSVGIAYADV